MLKKIKLVEANKGEKNHLFFDILTPLKQPLLPDFV